MGLGHMQVLGRMPWVLSTRQACRQVLGKLMVLGKPMVLGKMMVLGKLMVLGRQTVPGRLGLLDRQVRKPARRRRRR
jgi:hypothetical protein